MDHLRLSDHRLRLAGMALATLLTVLLLALRLAGGTVGRGAVAVVAVSQYAAAGATAVLVFRRMEPVAAEFSSVCE